VETIMSSITKPLIEADDDLLYPESDGQPMGETDWHIWALILLREGLDDFFADHSDVYVGSDLFFYYVNVKPPLRGLATPLTTIASGAVLAFGSPFRLRGEKYQPVAAAADGSLTSKELSLRLMAEGHMIRLIDARTGKPLLTRQERAEQAEQRAQALEAELARLRKRRGKK
jgi:hypothetical protein